ncbi:MAG: hypothetical protein L0Y71_19460 [Gemmataceae bacterium]|nr:hypothetical protein [Gemmataceae bacterium]
MSSKHQVLLAVEQMEDRCTPSAVLADARTHMPLDWDGSNAAQVRSREDAPDMKSAARVRAPRGHVIPIFMNFSCFGDATTMKASAEGTGVLGPWTAEGRLDSVRIDPVADRGDFRGAITVVTANGDQLFVSFTTQWRLSTGKGTETIRVTGGTGQYAGAIGHGIAACTITFDPATSTIRCNCVGVGFLILPRR